MRNIVPAFLVLGGALFATSAFAAPVALKCTGPEMGLQHFMYLWVDTDAKTAAIGRMDTTTQATAALPATISQDEIVFEAKGTGGDVFRYTMKRATGDLDITAENYEQVSVCNPDAGAQQK